MRMRAGGAAWAQAMTMAGTRSMAGWKAAAMGPLGAMARPCTAPGRRLGTRDAGADGTRHAPRRTRDVIVMPDTSSPLTVLMAFLHKKSKMSPH